jgi:hypothetical protein
MKVILSCPQELAGGARVWIAEQFGVQTLHRSVMADLNGRYHTD